MLKTPFFEKKKNVNAQQTARMLNKNPGKYQKDTQWKEGNIQGQKVSFLTAH